MKNIKIYFKTLLLMTIFVVSGCRLFDQPTVVKISPSDGEVLHSMTEIVINFSTEMNVNITEKSFNVISILGEFPEYVVAWSGKQCRIITNSAVKNGLYTFHIGTQAECRDGVNLDKDYSVTFQVGESLDLPVVKKAIIRSGNLGVFEIEEFLLEDEILFLEKDFIELEIGFNSPVEKQSIESNFKINPNINGFFVYDEIISNQKNKDFVNSFIFRPFANVARNQNFQVTIDKGLKCIDGNLSEKDFIFNFYNIKNTEIPSIVQACLTGEVSLDESKVNSVEKNDIFKFHFSKSMDRSTFSGIEISPYVATDIDYCSKENILEIKPRSNLEINRNYVLTIPKSLKDLSNNFLNKEYVFQLRVDAPNSYYLQVKDFYQKKISDGSYDLLEQDAILNITDPSYFYDSEHHDRELFVISARVEEIPENNILDYLSILSSVTFQMHCYNGSDLSTVRTPRITDIKLKDGNLIDIYIINLEPEVYYKLEIKGGESGVRDSAGNVFKDDVKIFFNT